MQALLEQQQTAFEKLRRYKVGALFMDPGTGKSRTTLELVRSVEGVDLCVWLAPYRSVNPKVAWTGIRSEVEKWGGPGCETVFCGIETLSSSDRTYLELHEKLSGAKRPFIIVDESLKVKNWEAIRTRRIIELGKLAEFKLILNGTPLSRNLLDLWAQMWFLSPRILNMDIAEFKNTFCEWVKMRKRVGNRTIEREWIEGYHNVDFLYELIGPYVFEAALVLDVKQVEHDVTYVVDGEHREEYDRLKEKYLDDEKMEALNNNIFLEMTMKMQHVYACSKGKVDAVNAIMARHGAESMVIYCKFIDSRLLCEEKFPKCRVLSIQSDAMSLNMQDRCVTVFWDRTWDYAMIDQAMHRTYRTGQEETCYYYHLHGNAGLETMMRQNVVKKGAMLAHFKRKSVEELRKLL